MRKVIIHTGLALLLLLSVASCTGWIWEDREECPCCLTLDMQYIPPEVKTMYLWVFGEKDQILHRDTLEGNTLEKAYQLLIKREEIRYFIWGNVQNATEIKDDATLDISLTKREGLSADSLYFYAGKVDARGESASDTIHPGKEFATVHLLLKNYHGEAELLQMELLSNSSGFYVDKRFLPGNGSVDTQPYQVERGDALFSFRISRQASLSEIRMHLTSYHKGVPIPVVDYPLGKWLSDNQYDMNAFNLSDIALELDLSTNFITIRTEDWETTLPTDVNF